MASLGKEVGRVKHADTDSTPLVGDKANIIEILTSAGVLVAGEHSPALDILLRDGALVRYERGAIATADALSDFHVVVDGTVHIVHYADSGREVLVCAFHAGDSFGAFPWMDDTDVSVDAVAMGAVSALRIRQRALFDAIRSDGELGLRLIERTAGLAAYFARRLVELTAEPARLRLRTELIRQARRHMIDDETGIIQPAPKHAELAALVGSQREEVSREMSELRHQGLVQKSNRDLLVRIASLEDIASRGASERSMRGR